MQTQRIQIKAADIKRGDRLVLGRKLGIKTISKKVRQKDNPGRVTLYFTEGWGYGFDGDKLLTIEREGA